MWQDMMDPSHPSKLAAVELTLDECGELLAAAAPSPAVRELRVRHGALARVVAGWRVMPPHSAQLAAMLECALDLRGMVVRACTLPPTRDPTTLPGIGPASRPPSRSSSWPRRTASAQRSTLPPPRDMAMATTKPPPRRRKRDG
jgi:hypothetical protein